MMILMIQLPPIEKINPFEKDETGAFFKEYPTHRALRKECGTCIFMWHLSKKNCILRIEIFSFILCVLNTLCRKMEGKASRKERT